MSDVTAGKTAALLASFLSARPDWPFCEDCLHEEVASASMAEARSFVATMKNQINFAPAKMCMRCGEMKPSIMAAD